MVFINQNIEVILQNKSEYNEIQIVQIIQQMIPSGHQGSYGNIGRREKFHLNIIFKHGTYHTITEKAKDFLRSYMSNDSQIFMHQLQRQQNRDLTYYLPQVGSWFGLVKAILDDTDARSIPEIFSTIVFPDLKFLHLRNNKIESVELLFRMEAPQLLVLQLSQNFIVNIKTLRKADWPSLEELILEQNLTIEFQCLPEANFLLLKAISGLNRERKNQQINVIHVIPKLETHKKQFQVNFSKNDLSSTQSHFEEVLEERFFLNKQNWPLFTTIDLI